MSQVDESKQKKILDSVHHQDTWDLTTIFADEAAWEKEYGELSELVRNLSDYKGLSMKKPADLYADLIAIDQFKNRLEKLYVYAQMRFDEDSTAAANQALNTKAVDLATTFAASLAFLEPELSQITPADWAAKEEAYEPLALYREYYRHLSALKDHLLSEREEALLSKAGPILNSSRHIFGLLNNADFNFPKVHNEKGESVQLTHAVYQSLLQSVDPTVRQEAFTAYYSVYRQFNNSLAGTLSTAIRRNNFLAEVRGYDSARQKSLFENQIPEPVYDQLLETIHKRIDLLHRYTSLRKRLLNLDEMHSSDFYVPMVGRVLIKPTYEEGKTLVLAALKHLGEEYLAIVKKAFAERWIDVYEKKGKRSGAYSGGTYGTNPFILMNWQDQLGSVYTLIHELGHSVHSYYARENQPYIYSDYPIFLAEIASTTNENLLTNYLLEQADDPAVKAYILAHYLDGFKATVFRQTQFAEFEHEIHEADRRGQPLTADFLNRCYKDLNREYYGPALADDDLIAYEWSRIPHFYYNYYVYQYATGFSAATAFARRIRSSESQRAAYLDFLKAGRSAPPIDLLKRAGLDMTTAEPIDEALDVFRYYLEELEKYTNQF